VADIRSTDTPHRRGSLFLRMTGFRPIVALYEAMLQRFSVSGERSVLVVNGRGKGTQTNHERMLDARKQSLNGTKKY